MRVAVVTQYPRSPEITRGGVSSVSLSLVRNLEEIGDIDLHVITIDKELCRMEVTRSGCITVHRIPPSRWPQMADIFCGPGRRTIKNLIRDIRPDIVHFHETYGLAMGELSVPVVMTVHGFDHANIVTEKQPHAYFRSFLWRGIEAWGLSRQKYIISINPYVRKQIAEKTKAMIVDIDNPVDAACFSTNRSPLPGRVFFAGWISPRKNPITLIRAIGALVKQGLDISAHIAGEQKDRKYATAVKNEICRSNLDKHVTLLGRLKAKEILAELARAQVFVLPSLQENAPMAISEALAVGVPVIASNRCGMPYMIDNCQTGFLIEPYDVAELSEKIARLVTDKNLNSAMSIAAKRFALEHYHPLTVSRKTYDLYRKILSENGRKTVREKSNHN